MSEERDESMEEFLGRISERLGWALRHEEFYRRFEEFLLEYWEQHQEWPPSEEWLRVTQVLLEELFADHPAVGEYRRLKEALFSEATPPPLEMQDLVDALIRHLWENFPDAERHSWWSELFRLRVLAGDFFNLWFELKDRMPNFLLPEKEE